MAKTNWWQILSVIALGSLAGLAAACGDDDDGASDDAGTDTDTDSDVCEEIEWGSGLKAGETVSNWVQSGYIDADLDGVVEQEEIEFDFELIHCTGKEALVIVYGDTS
jgi:hypothetical protein